MGVKVDPEVAPIISMNVVLRIQLIVRIPECANIHDPDWRGAAARYFLIEGLSPALIF